MNKLIILSLMAFTIYPSVTNAEVKSMSLETFKEEDSVRFWEVEVKCDDNTEQLMKRVVGQGNPWCSVSDTASCNESKFTLSRSLCGAGRPVEVAIAPRSGQGSVSDDNKTPSETSVADVATEINKSLNVSSEAAFTESVAVKNSTNSLPVAEDILDPIKESKKTELMREQVQIEEQRILIEQKRLELRKAELELNKLKANQ